MYWYGIVRHRLVCTRRMSMCASVNGLALLLLSYGCVSVEHSVYEQQWDKIQSVWNYVVHADWSNRISTLIWQLNDANKCFYSVVFEWIQMYNMQGSVYACVYLFVSVSLKHSVIHILLCSPLNSLFLSHSLISFMPRLDKIHEKPFNLNFTTIFRFSSCVSLLVPFRFVSFRLAFFSLAWCVCMLLMCMPHAMCHLV